MAMTLTPDTQRPRYWMLAGLVLFFTLISVQYTLKILDGPHRSAILRWQPQLRALNDGANIWNDHNYPNPPMMALLLSPLGSMSPVAASLLWFYVKVVLAFLSIHWALLLAESYDWPMPRWAQALAIVLSLRPIASDLTHGNVNIVILFLVVGSLYAFRQRRDGVAGLLLALSIACKITPALFVPYFIWKRAWGMLAGCTVGLVLFFGLIPGLQFGMERNAEFLHSWVDKMVVPYVVRWEVTSDHNNQSLPGFAARMLTHRPSFADYVNDIYTPLEYHNIVTLDESVVRWLLKGTMLAFAGLVMWTCRTPISRRTDWRLAAEFSIVVIGMLLFSERTWKHHCVTLLLPVSVLVYCLVRYWSDRVVRYTSLGALSLSVVLTSLTSTGLFSDHDRLGKLAQAYGGFVWAFFITIAALCVVLRRMRNVDDAPTSVYRVIAATAPLSPRGRRVGGEGANDQETSSPSPPAPLPQGERGEMLVN